MINTSDAYREAIVGDARRMYLRAVIDIIDPDITYNSATSSGIEPFAETDQLHNKDTQLTSNYGSCELNRWVLDGSMYIEPEGESAYTGNALSQVDGTFTEPQWIQLNFDNVEILQACSVYFSQNYFDGHPVDFTVEVMQGGTAYYTKSFTDFNDTSVSLSGFTVYNPDAIKVTITRLSLPYRRARIAEIIAGVYEIWTGDDIATFSLKMQGNISSVSLPYNTASITMDNQSRRFEPRRKDGIFQSIEAQQHIDISMGVETATETEYVSVGRFYQHSGGWTTGDNGLTIAWDLVDIIGLLTDREYIPPATLPTTLGAWAQSFVSQLGNNFTESYSVDENYAALPLTATLNDVTGKKIGDLIRFAAMATATWPRADAQTGYLCFEPLWSQGDKITLDNLVSYPTIKANNTVAALVFKLDNDVQYVVSGNSTAASETVSIDNPFIHTQAQALTAARMILSAYGGNRLEIVGRGNPASEIGDVDTVWLDESQATTARRIEQDLSFSGGVLKNSSSVLLQADGSYLYQKREIITQSGTWTAPAGVSKLRVILVGGGTGAGMGTDGTWSSAGVNGPDGDGAHVWSDTININAQQSFNVTIGAGGAASTVKGAAGAAGTPTVFGQYSSDNGSYFEYGFTDIANGDSFARTAVVKPVNPTGDGAKGTAGGVQGHEHEEERTRKDGSSYTRTVIDNYPGVSEVGNRGADGCVIVYYDK